MNRTGNIGEVGAWRRGASVGAVSVLAACVLLMSSGCARPLLSPEDERSPFDRYDALRNQYAQQYTEDEYGRQKPNLRARLTPKE